MFENLRQSQYLTSEQTEARKLNQTAEGQEKLPSVGDSEFLLLKPGTRDT